VSGARQADPGGARAVPDQLSPLRDAATPRAEADKFELAVAARPLVLLRQLVACWLLLLLSARLPSRLVALAVAVLRPAGQPPQAAADALGMLGLDGFGVLCAIYLSHARLRGVRMLRCYPPQRLIPLSLHFLGLLWGLLTLALPSGVSVR
jgi:hypothetical protein